jgi:hypothetical protein
MDQNTSDEFVEHLQTGEKRHCRNLRTFVLFLSPPKQATFVELPSITRVPTLRLESGCAGGLFQGEKEAANGNGDYWPPH